MTNPLEVQPLVLKSEEREKRQTQKNYETALRELKTKEWYNRLSPEQQKKVEKKYEERFDLEKKIAQKKAEMQYKGVSVDIMKKGLELNLSKIEDNEDIKEINNFKERVDMLNRDIELLSRELYDINLKLDNPRLQNSFDKRLEKNKEDKTLKEFLEKVDMKKVSAGEIYILKKKGYDLSKLFLDSTKSNSEVSKETMKVGDKFVVNFGGNKSLNQKIGAGDLLPIDKFATVKINGVLGERKENPRPGYYASDGRYLAIFDNYNVEIISEKALKGEDLEKYVKSFENRYTDVRGQEIISGFQKQLSSSEKSIKFDGKFLEDFGVLMSFIGKNAKNIFSKLDFNKETGKISVKNGKTFKDIFGSIDSIGSLGKGYLKYKDTVKEVCNNHPNISEKNLIKLINHENGEWNPQLHAYGGGTAYGLGQMINGTWDIYGKYGFRSDPEEQLRAVCKYLDAIMKNKNCGIELAMAYYNTGEAIMSISQSELDKYCKNNFSTIVAKIPSGTEITPRTYFTGAVAYYNNISYEQALLISSRAT